VQFGGVSLKAADVADLIVAGCPGERQPALVMTRRAPDRSDRADEALCENRAGCHSEQQRRKATRKVASRAMQHRALALQRGFRAARFPSKRMIVRSSTADTPLRVRRRARRR
jgi:hypothetical protein